MKMFNYLNQKQISDMMLLFCLADKIEEIVDRWVVHENMTKEEAKYIRTSKTYYNKFFNSSDMMLLFCLADKIEEIVDRWVVHENMTKEEAKYIRTSKTYYNKFFNSVQERLPDKEKDKLIKRYSNFHMSIQDKWLLKKFQDDMNEKSKTVRMERHLFDKFAIQDKLIKRYSNFHMSIQDKWLLKKFQDDMNEKSKTVRMERHLFDKFAIQLFNKNCKDCTKTSEECELHDILYENLFPAEEKMKNCCYAFESQETKLERLKREEEKRLAKELKKNTLSKRAKKKKANRFDEDDEIIEYNFTPKGDK